MTVTEAKPHLQKLLKTDLKLHIRFYKKFNPEKEDPDLYLQKGPSRRLAISYFISLLVIINNDSKEKQY